MIVGNREKFVFPFQYPSFTIGNLTLGTMSVATRIVTNRFAIAITTLGDMTAKHFGSTQGNCPERFLYLNHRAVILFKLFAVKMDYVR
jgi:hypothetical protein